MNKSINSYQDLLAEKKRLTLLLNERKIVLKTEFEEIKSRLKPLGNVLETVEKLSSKNTSNPLINAGIDMGVNLLLKNVFLRNAGWIVKLLMPALVKNYLSHETEEKNNLFSKIGSFFKKQVKQHLQA